MRNLKFFAFIPLVLLLFVISLPFIVLKKLSIAVTNFTSETIVQLAEYVCNGNPRT